MGIGHSDEKLIYKTAQGILHRSYTSQKTFQLLKKDAEKHWMDLEKNEGFSDFHPIFLKNPRKIGILVLSVIFLSCWFFGIASTQSRDGAMALVTLKKHKTRSGEVPTVF